MSLGASTYGLSSCALAISPSQTDIGSYANVTNVSLNEGLTYISSHPFSGYTYGIDEDGRVIRTSAMSLFIDQDLHIPSTVQYISRELLYSKGQGESFSGVNALCLGAYNSS
jgi:hypothetical protein